MEGTKDQLAELLRIINSFARMKGAEEFYIQNAYGKPRLYQKAGNAAREISPRLPRPQLYIWMHAFIDGIQFQISPINPPKW